jgi:hypothetical protein
LKPAGDIAVFCGRRIGPQSVVTYTRREGTHLLPLVTWRGQLPPPGGFHWGDRSPGAQCLALSLAMQVFGEAIGRSCYGAVLDHLVVPLTGPAWELTCDQVRRAGLKPVALTA